MTDARSMGANGPHPRLGATREMARGPCPVYVCGMRRVGHLLVLFLAIAPGIWPRFACCCSWGTECKHGDETPAATAPREDVPPCCRGEQAAEDERSSPAQKEPRPCRCPGCPNARPGDETTALAAVDVPTPALDVASEVIDARWTLASPVTAVANLAHPPGPPRELLGPVVLRI